MNTWNFYSHLYEKYRSSWPFNWLLQKEKAQLLELIELLPFEKWTILDLGCGTGDSLNLILDRKMLMGLDSNKKMARIAAQKHFPIMIAEVTHLPIKPHSISLFQLIGVSEYLKNLCTLFDEFAQVGRSHPSFYVLMTSSPQSFITQLRKLTGHKIYVRKSKDIAKIARSRGFNLVKHIGSFSQDSYLFKSS
jgi:trans-aconitate methyltransferase